MKLIALPYEHLRLIGLSTNATSYIIRSWHYNLIWMSRHRRNSTMTHKLCSADGCTYINVYYHTSCNTYWMYATSARP